MKRLVSIFGVILLNLSLVSLIYPVKVGLDSGHSIKELHKSGGAFDVMVIENGYEVPKPYYAVGWSRTNLFS
jgi:hypothetical protein